MFRRGSTRRVILAASLAGGMALGGTPADAGDDNAHAAPAEPEIEALGGRVRRLSELGRTVDYDDAAAEARYYAEARPVIEAVISVRASCRRGLQLKAEALVWCHGGQVVAGPQATQSERLVASLVADLLRAA